MAIGTDKLLFIHVPRTGGTWVLQAMFASGVKLKEEREDKHHLVRHECDFRGRFTFAVVREPLAWYASQYNYRRKMRFDDGGFPGDPWLDLPFAKFLDNMITHHPGHLGLLYKAFVGAPDEEPLSLVGRTESLVEDTVKALRLAGEDFKEDILRGWHRANESGGSSPMSSPPPELVSSELEVYERFYPQMLAVSSIRESR